MNQSLKTLISLLELEPIEKHLFRGQSVDLGWGRIYGGQVLAQAVKAAAATAPADRPIHSMHAYFLRPGDPYRPVVYDVDRIRDGRSFTTRRVVALQNGEALFNCSASFQSAAEGFEHQDVMPEVVGPDELRPDEEMTKEVIEKMGLPVPDKIKNAFTGPRPFDVRSVNFVNPIAPEKSEARHRAWLRPVDTLPEDPALHAGLLAWVSDYNFLVTALRPHQISWMTPGFQLVSVDHAMWFHRPINLNQWHLIVVDSPVAAGTRAFVRGEIFDQSGVLVASVTQEGLARKARPKRAGAKPG